MGLVGARFEKNKVMEFSIMCIDDNQNIEINGYGNKYIDDSDADKKIDENKLLENELNDNLFMDRVDELFSKHSNDKNNDNESIKHNPIWRAFERFYSIKYFPTYDEIKEKYDKAQENNNKNILNRYFEKNGYGQFLDIKMYKIRMRISMEIFLFDADRRAKERFISLKASNSIDDNRLYGAFCHIVGLGTGVWELVGEEQDRLIVEITKEIINDTNLQYINGIYFSWMKPNCMYYPNTEDAIFSYDENNKSYFIYDASKKHKIYIENGRRNPADILTGKFKKCLPIAMYAWDSNAFPGNEYYLSSLSASGDPAAASCSTIPYVQNSEINKEYITGENSGVYYYNKSTKDYEFIKLKDINFNNGEWFKKSILSIPL